MQNNFTNVAWRAGVFSSKVKEKVHDFISLQAQNLISSILVFSKKLRLEANDKYSN